MTKTRIVAVALLLAVLLIGCAQAVAESERPPHAAPRTGAVSSRLQASDVADRVPQEAADAVSTGDLAAWIEGEQRAAWYRGVEEAQGVASLARSPVRASVGGGIGGDCTALAAQLGLPEAVLWRESRCSRDAYNATGCYGRGCYGPAQVDAGHTYADSPWNSDSTTPGTCYGLDLGNPADYATCVSRLPPSAWAG